MLEWCDDGGYSTTTAGIGSAGTPVQRTFGGGCVSCQLSAAGCLQRTGDESLHRVRDGIFIVLLGTSSLIFIKIQRLRGLYHVASPQEGTRTALGPPRRDRAVRSRDVHVC